MPVRYEEKITITAVVEIPKAEKKKWGRIKMAVAANASLAILIAFFFAVIAAKGVVFFIEPSGDPFGTSLFLALTVIVSYIGVGVCFSLYYGRRMDDKLSDFLRNHGWDGTLPRRVEFV